MKYNIWYDGNNLEFARWSFRIPWQIDPTKQLKFSLVWIFTIGRTPSKQCLHLHKRGTSPPLLLSRTPVLLLFGSLTLLHHNWKPGAKNWPEKRVSWEQSFKMERKYIRGKFWFQSFTPCEKLTLWNSNFGEKNSGVWVGKYCMPAPPEQGKVPISTMRL